MDSTRLKILITAGLIVAAAAVTAVMQSGSTVTVFQSEGLIIDFDEYDTDWAEMDVEACASPLDALKKAADTLGCSVVISEDGVVEEVDGHRAQDGLEWAFWTIGSGSTIWTKVDDASSWTCSGCVAHAWACRAPGEEPTVAVDQSGSSIYGYPQKSRSVTLSPSITEMMGAINAVSTLVGTDKYSNYPFEVLDMRASGHTAVVGDYTSPSFEAIINTDPDVVFCDGSQYNHIQLRDRLAAVNVCAILLYEGESVSDILDNLFIVGVVMGYDMAAAGAIDDLQQAMVDIADSMGPRDGDRVMVSLSGDSSPWVAGSYTYISDLLSDTGAENVFDSMDGWVHINSELVSEADPDVIIILTTDYSATQQDYDYLISHLSSEWKGTDAYRNGRIYLITESAGEMSQRPGPRFAQLTELLSMILSPDSYEKELPKYIGDDYTDYLTITKNLGFE